MNEKKSELHKYLRDSSAETIVKAQLLAKLEFLSKDKEEYSEEYISCIMTFICLLLDQLVPSEIHKWFLERVYSELEKKKNRKKGV